MPKCVCYTYTFIFIIDSLQNTYIHKLELKTNNIWRSLNFYKIKPYFI